MLYYGMHCKILQKQQLQLAAY